MPSRANREGGGEDLSSGLGNLAPRGLGFRNENGQLEMVTKATLQMLGTASLPLYGLRGQVWGIRYSRDPSFTHRVFVPKTAVSKALTFEAFVDNQTGGDISFKTKHSGLWRAFTSLMEEAYEARGEKIYTIAEHTGLQTRNLVFDDRSTERYIFGPDLILDETGKKLKGKKIDCVFFPTLSMDPRQSKPLLQAVNFETGGREVMEEIIRVAAPDPNFFPCNLAIAAGLGQFHGHLMRDITGGQMPIVSFTQILNLLCTIQTCPTNLS